ncbi:DUF1844 domain-containing protein [Bremerella cremea]|uniref:DUF1844 domain-containing protein n=1 Tax=Bremerella cremea TaxID=1031537 RepID=A0A368KNT0_9BACT|nr:DUF1844 domain-containing protein [Bremerella cremea]RCS46040.1 DUF1844 domain-containing protein [Bremerella cremea]
MSEDPEKKIVVDGDWKEQVRQEKEKQAIEEQPEAPIESPAEATPPPSPGKLPKADFGFLISMMATQAFAAMGQIPEPGTGQVTKQPEVAKHMIDLLAMLEEKTQGNLDANEKAGLQNVLYQLRMAFVASQQG